MARSLRRRFTRRTATREPLFLVGTPGGHLDLLIALREAFEPYDRIWVTSAGSTADMLVSEGEEVRVLPRFHGFSPASLRQATKSFGPVIRERPRLIVTSGSGSVVPFCLGARALGARMLYIETMARVHDASDAGKVLSRVADAVFVQWPEMTAVYPHARVHVCRPVLLDRVDMDAETQHDVKGTFVAVGTHIDQFDRLLRETDAAVAAGILPSPAIAQTGACTYVPRHMEGRQWMLPQEMDRIANNVEYVVCHAGSGMIARALNAGITPLVMPRLKALGEHVDDHQLQITEKLGAFDLVVPVHKTIRQNHLDDTRRPRPDPDAISDFEPMRVKLAAELRGLIGE